MKKGWERTFHFLTWAVQGSSYLNPRAYAVMHRMHHAFSDTPRDPHSPFHAKSAMAMMLRTKFVFEAIKHRRMPVEPRFEGGYPEWPLLDDSTSSWTLSIAWGACYALLYWAFAPPALLVLLPLHWVMGPVHGLLVNWLGHTVGYRNFATNDRSRNTLAVDVLTMGELFQNNHHRFSRSPNFAVRAFEVDPGYIVIRALAWAGIVDLSGAQKGQWSSGEDERALGSRSA